MTVKLKFLLWKNLKSEKRMWFHLFGELLSIFLLCILIIANPSNVEEFFPTKSEKLSFKIYAQDTLDDLNIVRKSYEEDKFPSGLAYKPEKLYAKEITQEVAQHLGLKTTEKYDPNKSFAKLTFSGDKGDDVPEKLTVRISFPASFRTYNSSRMHSNLWISRCTGRLTTIREDSPHELQTDLYIREGFLQIQHMIFLKWFEKVGPANPQLTVYVRSFAYDTNERLCTPNNLPNVLSILYYFVFFLPFLNLLWKYGRESQENLIAHHWRYGCGKFKYWFSHFICSFIHFLVLDAFVYVLTIISWKTRTEIEYSNPFIMLYLLPILLLTTCEFIFVAMIIATLVRNAKNAVYVGIIIWVLLYALFTTLLEYSLDVTSPWMIFSLIAFFNNDFAYSMRYLMKLDERTSPDIWYLLGVVLLSAILKFLLLIIVQFFVPLRYRTRPKLLFCSKRDNHCKYVKSKLKLFESANSFETSQGNPMHALKNIQITGVYKSVERFRKPGRSVLRNVTMTIYKGEITVILGHSSAGKTTLASLLAGWQKPDEGSIKFYDKDIKCDMEVIRMADVSMPNNALFDYLTAFETLVYFINIKGRFEKPEQYNEECLKWLKNIRLVIKSGDEYRLLVKNMTHEQKHLLSLCCILSCNTRIIILDEPTAYMMAHEQRIYWSILQREKMDRSIIVMSKYLRESETIADRIGILVDGHIAAYGTVMFLKTSFGFGFNLIILKEKDSPTEPITKFLKDYVTDVKPHVVTNAQVVYKLPAEKRSVFQILLIQLQKRYDDFGIIDSRILTADLTEVIFSLAQTTNNQKIPDIPQALSVDFLPKKGRMGQQWSAMFFKKFAHQPSLMVPILMSLASILLITLIVQLLFELRRRDFSSNAFPLGFDQSHNRSILKNLHDCKLIGIKKVIIGNTLDRDRAHSFVFLSDSFVCSDMGFREYVDESDEMGHMYGALEKTDTDGKFYTAYVNQHILHSAPLVLNLVHNYILEMYFLNTPDKPHIIRIINDPYPIPAPHATDLLNAEIEHLYVPLAVGVILPLTVCTFIIPIVLDRQSNALMLMLIAGLRIDIYWLVNFIWDWLTFFAYSIVLQVIIIVLYFNDIRLKDSFLIFFLINVYSIPLLASLYLTSMLYPTGRYRAYMSVCLFHIMGGLFAYVFYWDVLLPQEWNLHFLLILPTFALLDGISNVFVLSRYFKKCSQLCAKLDTCKEESICDTIEECCKYKFFEWGNSGILRSFIFLLITTIIIILLIFWVEIHQRESKFLVSPRVKKMFTKVTPFDDPDVVKMRERIASSDLRTISKKRLVVDQVERNIPHDSMALSTTSFDLEKHHCLAIYGTGRVGKSHLCRQIVGQDSFRFGDIYIRGIPLKYNIHEAWVHLGYAPQKLGILNKFAVIEILHFFCLIRGVPKGAIRTIVSDVSSLLGLEKVMHKKIRYLTKGQKRKVIFAVALMATNKVIILDEPTTGLPTWTCREIWKAIRYLCACGKSVLLTTRNMYECDSVADEVLLIDEQQMLAYGKPYYLRGRQIGFYLEVKIRREGETLEEVEENFRVDVENLHRFMIFMHTDAILVSQNENFLKFYLPVEPINFNILYGSLERNKARLNIAEYTVSQGNFEELLKKISQNRPR